ncbi:hypothetical protein HY989_04940 [Candidatus Micrarchaeota archaeon]|nr:hypothetical protein [Candidatus Micrarchaeota archaeon]
MSRIGTDGVYNYFGRSRAVDPYGNTVVEGGTEEELLIAEIDFKAATGFKGIVDFLSDRKPKTYSKISTPAD